MQPAEMLCCLLHSCIFLVRSDYEQTRLKAHTDTHTHTGKLGRLCFLICDPLPQIPFFGFISVVFLTSVVLLVLLPPFFLLLMMLHPCLFSFPFFSFNLCSLGLLIIHSLSFSLKQENGPVKNMFKTIECLSFF